MDFDGFQWISMEFNGFQWISMDFHGFQSANCESEKIRIRFWAICSHLTLNTNMIREDLTRSHPRSPQETFFYTAPSPFGKNRGRFGMSSIHCQS